MGELNKAVDEASRWQALSALADGEAEGDALASLTAAWRDDAALRERWHAYQLIGDVLRSDDLAACSGDAAFLQRLRGRLEREPVVLAPSVRSAEPAMDRVGNGAMRRTRGRVLRRWAPPAAVAAGFVAVAGALTVMRGPGGVEAPGTPAAAVAPQLAQAPAPSPVAAPPPLMGPVAATERTAERNPPAYVLVRDAQLDQYLAAHQQFGGSSALGVPSGFLRGATYEGASNAAPGAR